jgi:hypothetical protein
MSPLLRSSVIYIIKRNDRPYSPNHFSAVSMYIFLKFTVKYVGPTYKLINSTVDLYKFEGKKKKKKS